MHDHDPDEKTFDVFGWAAIFGVLFLLVFVGGRACAEEAAAPLTATRAPFRRSLLWATIPKAWDLYSTAECIDKNPRCYEANLVQPSAEHRAALGAAVTVGMAAGFDWAANSPHHKIRVAGWVARITWAVSHGVVGWHNWKNSRQR